MVPHDSKGDLPLRNYITPLENKSNACVALKNIPECMMRAKMSSNKKQPRPIDKKAGRTQCQMLFSDLMVTTTIAGRVIVTVQLNHDKK